MQDKKFSFIETLLIECLFFFAFFGILRYLNIGSPKLFFIIAIILMAGYLLIGTASYIETLRKEEAESRMI